MTTKKQRKIQLKRGLASLLALSLAIPTVGSLTAFAGQEIHFSDEWGRCTACSEETPHLIYTKEDLDKIRTHLDENGRVTGYFQLANDIVFEEADFAVGGDFYRNGLGWLPIGDDGSTGSSYTPATADIWLDGNNCTISGLEMHSFSDDVIPETLPQGMRDLSFIARPGNATIQNLTFDGAYIASRKGAAVVYGAGTAETTVRNVTVTNSTVVNMGGASGQTAVFARIAGGLLEDITITDSANIRTDRNGNTSSGWGQTFFTGRLLENTIVRNITIQDCELDAYAYAALFTTDMRSGVCIDGVTIRNLAANWSHHAMFSFAGEIWDSAVQNPNADRENISIRNVSLEADMTYGGSNYSSQIIPEMSGFEMRDSVLVYRQDLPVVLTAAEGTGNAGEFENVYIVRIPEGGARSILYCKDGEGQSEVSIPETLSLEAGSTYRIAALPGGTVSYQSSGAAVSVGADGMITAESEGSAVVTVLVKMSDSAEPVSLAEIVVTAGSAGGQVAKTELQSLYNQHKEKENSGYTSENWTLFQNALAAAFAVLNRETADQAAVNAAKSQLEEAVSGLKIPEDYTKLTIDGAANAGLYVSENANSLLQLAQKELQDFVKKISGAELPAISTLSGSGLEIVLATPDTVPEITVLFAEDLEWIGDTDGFAIRTMENKIYILAQEARGVLNGVYDFLEENAGILWTRGVEELGTLYEEAPTISIQKADYREKSPFQLRGWNACGQGTTGVHHFDTATRWFEGRNKLNARVGTMGGDIGNIEIDGKNYTTNGHVLMAGGTTLSIDKYFESHPEYFMTNADGTPKKSQYGSNLNFYNLEAAEVLAQELYDSAAKNKLTYVSHSIQDNQYFCMAVPDENGNLVDLASQPFTADNGVTVTPDMNNYKSTVFFNFLNRAARKLKELDPELKIISLAYIYCEYPPAVEIEDNIVIQFAPIYSDDHLPIETASSNAQVKKNLTGWAEKTKNIVVYNYYASLPCAIYSRPIAEKVQKDYQFYAELGLLGLTPEGGVDSAPGYVNYDAWSMNHLYYWLMDRLMWDPYADLDALTVDFCDKAYGEGSEAMQEYYRLIQSGWDMYDDYVWYTSGGDTYIKKFIIDAGVGEAASKALADAYAASDEAGQKRIALIQEIFEEQLAKYADFVAEDGAAYRTELGKEALVAEENMTVTSGPWSKVKPLTVFKNPDLIDSPRAVEVRLMWDEENVYVAYKVPNENIGTEEDPYGNIPPLTADGSWWNGGPEFMETYLCGNMTNMTEYSAFYTDAIDQQIQYNVGPSYAKGPYGWESHSAILADGEPADRYWMNVLVIPFETLGVTSKTATLGGTFVANIYGGPGPYYGWCGSNVWSTSSFRLIKMVDETEGEPSIPDEKQEIPPIPVMPSKPAAAGWALLPDGRWEYRDADGAPLTGWQKINGAWYYMDENGTMLTGWQQINDVWYYLKDWGGMATGWQQINGVWYYLKDWGGMATGWQQINGVWYYLKDWGGMATGWQQINGVWYYLKDWGGMATGWQQINDTWYYLKDWGGMAVGTITPDGYYVDATGAWIAP
ncbi:MAG: DUF4838 domain-containing protein [Candidatus Merdivicinus sp.]